MTLTCRIHGAKDLRLEDDGPSELAAHDVELKLGAGGICGSDLHYFHHGRVGAFVMREPLIPGHEASGIVARIGSGVTRVQVGDKVAINPSHACGQCDYCLDGRFNLCRHMRFLGSASVFPHVQGMFRERFVMGEKQLTAIHEDISLGELACAEPLSIGLHAAHRAGELMGKTVLVTGGGTIGCMCVMAVKLAGAAKIIVCDIAERALTIAKQVGADETIRSDQAAPESLADIADISIEAAGSPAAARRLQASRELDYVGAFRAAHAFDWAVQYLRKRRVDVRPLLTAQIPLSRSLEAFELASDRSRSTKVQVVCD